MPSFAILGVPVASLCHRKALIPLPATWRVRLRPLGDGSAWSRCGLACVGSAIHSRSPFDVAASFADQLSLFIGSAVYAGAAINSATPVFQLPSILFHNVTPSLTRRPQPAVRLISKETL